MSVEEATAERRDPIGLAVLRALDGSWASWELMDLAPKSAVVRRREGWPSGVVVAQALRVELESQWLGRPVNLSARVVAEQRSDDVTVVDLAFELDLPLTAFTESARSHLLSLGAQSENRRRAFRLRLGPKTSLTGRLTSPTCKAPVKGVLANLSATGARLTLTAGEAARLGPSDLLDLVLVLPRQPRPLRLGVLVRARQPDNLERDHVHLGLEFDPARTARFDAQQEVLVDFLMREQRQRLRGIRPRI